MNIGSGPSPPTYPFANSFKVVAGRETSAGANAVAEAKSDTMITDFMVAGDDNRSIFILSFTVDQNHFQHVVIAL